MFSASLINKDYHTVFIERKKDKCLKNKAMVFQKYMACNIHFLKSRKWSKERDNNNNNNNNNNSLFTFPFLHNITMFSIFRKREEKLDSY